MAGHFIWAMPAYGLKQDRSDAAKDRVLKAAARAFVEAEAKSYIEKFLNQHPPTSSMAGFGSNTMFTVQLLLAADNYLKADNDKQRFHAIEQGSSAYIAYAYAATPAVGLAITTVVLATQVIEANISSSYAEAQLALYKDMLSTQLRINELRRRLGAANALRFLAFVDETQQVTAEIARVNRSLSLDCRRPASNFERLGDCLSFVIQAVTLRETQLGAIDRLLDSPDSMLELLALGDDSKKTTTRQRLETVRKGTEDQLASLRKIYDGFEDNYKGLAVSLISDEALAEPQRLEALEDVKSRCLLDQTSLSLSASQLVYQITLERVKLAKGERKIRAVMTTTGHAALSLIENFEQRRVSCPAIANDADLAALIGIVRDRLRRLPEL